MRPLLIFSISLIIFTIPIASMAAEPIVPCDGATGEVCQACHVVQLGQRILTWFISVMAAVIALVFVIGGLKMVMAGGNEGEITKARSMMTNAIIGFIILLASWLIIDTVMKTFVRGVNTEDTADDFLLGPWNEIECKGQPTLTGAPSVPGTTPPSGACEGCVVISSSITVKDGACSGTEPCTVSSLMNARLIELDNRLEGVVTWQVTEAYPPTVTHQNQCHNSGTCVDANCIGGCSASQINTFYDAARASGLNPVYEVATDSARDELIAGGTNPSAIVVVPGITAPHFSVYGG